MFLSNRTQQVMVNGSFSSLCTVTSRVPQGSVLGPALFLIYMNDITAGIKSQISLFADDCLIYRSIHSPIDHEILQGVTWIPYHAGPHAGKCCLMFQNVVCCK